ncbi:hypothetical protein ACROYT_G024770 [Oculina patagonica]
MASLYPRYFLSFRSSEELQKLTEEIHRRGDGIVAKGGMDAVNCDGVSEKPILWKKQESRRGRARLWAIEGPREDCLCKLTKSF